MSEEVWGLIQGVLLVVAALFPIVDPLGNAPFFLAMTEEQTDADRAVLARKVAINGFLLLLAAIFLGGFVLAFFGIAVPVVQVAGGLVVASLGWERLKASPQESKSPRKAPVTAGASAAKAFYPLTLPLTVGPGSISVAVTIGANFPSTVQPFIADADLGDHRRAHRLRDHVDLIQLCRPLEQAAWSGGLAVVMRLSAFILLCIGVQIMWNGIDALFGFAKLLHPAAP